MPPRRCLTSALLILTSLYAPRSPAQDPTPLAKLPGPSGTAAEFSRDGKLILTAGGDQARVWDAETFKPVTGPLRHGHESKLLIASFSPDRTQVVTAAGGEVRLWDSSTGKQRLLLRHKAKVRCVAFSPDGFVLATGGDDEIVHFWDVRSGHETMTLKHGAPVRCAVFSPDGRRLLTHAQPYDDDRGHTAPGTVRVWATGSKEVVWSLAAALWPFRADEDEAYPLRRLVAFSPDGRTVAVIALREVQFRGADTGEVVGSGDTLDEAGTARGVAFSPDSRMAITATRDGAVTWQVAARHKLVGPVVAEFEWVGDAVFSPDGRLVLTSTLNSIGEFCATVWEVGTGVQRRSIVHRGNHMNDIPAVAFSPDGRRVAAGFPSDGFTGVWAAGPTGGDAVKK